MNSAINPSSSSLNFTYSSPRKISPFALAAALLITALSLATLHSNTATALPSVVNGSKVIELAPVYVTPSAAEMRAALLSPSTPVAMARGAAGTGAVGRSSASLLGEQLAMPYYSFGKKSSVSKD